ncbi:hypothetical protein ACFLZL_02255 [Thermodesulfobacteriota bacterium]
MVENQFSAKKRQRSFSFAKKKTNQKKSPVFHDPPHGIGGQASDALRPDDPALLASAGVCETRPPEKHRRSQTVTASISTDPVMLGT